MTENTTTPTGPDKPCRRHGRRGGMRRLFLAIALVAGGVGMGIVGSAVSQGYGPHRDGYGGPMGGRMHGEQSESGPTGWHGPRHGGPRAHHGGAMFGPGSVERMVNRIGFATDASTEQKQKMNTIAQRTAEEILVLREKHLAGRNQIRDLLAAPTIDRGKLESLRAEQMKLADDASKRITTAVADIAEVLTPTQRADLAKRMERRFGAGR